MAVDIIARALAANSGGTGTSNYESLTNKPSINGVELSGDKDSQDLEITKVVDIGSGQYSYESYVLPTIDADLARQIYSDDKAGIPQVLHWTLYGSENNFKIVSSDHISGQYSIDILVHNKYHCAYLWDDDTTGDIEPDVQTQQEVPTFTNGSLGVIKGSDTDGNVGANLDGTGSINGWTQVKNRITLLEGAVPTKVKDVKLNGTSVVNEDKEAILTASTEISDTPSDSKLVTEKTIYDYIASGNDGKTRKLDAVDLNTVTNTGLYSCNVCTNRPTANNGVMLVLKNGFSSDNLVQVYWTFTADVMWVRHKDLGNWKQWASITKDANIVTSITSDTLVLNNNQEARLGTLSTLILTMPATIDDIYETNLVFTSGSTATTLTYSATPIKWVGDDCDVDQDFVPEPNVSYEINIKKLGTNEIIARVGAF